MQSADVPRNWSDSEANARHVDYILRASWSGASRSVRLNSWSYKPPVTIPLASYRDRRLKIESHLWAFQQLLSNDDYFSTNTFKGFAIPKSFKSYSLLIGLCKLVPYHPHKYCYALFDIETGIPPRHYLLPYGTWGDNSRHWKLFFFHQQQHVHMSVSGSLSIHNGTRNPPPILDDIKFYEQSSE